jgi:hypothetical protein
MTWTFEDSPLTFDSFNDCKRAGKRYCTRKTNDRMGEEEEF